MFSLTNTTAIVTGAGSGIGAAIAARFAAAGAFVYVVDRDESAAATVATQVRADGHEAESIGVDVTDAPACQRAAQLVLSQRGRCDVLVNNAGIGHVGTILTTNADDLDRLFAVNVRGVFHMTKLLLPSMIERGAGSVINVASIGGVVGLVDRLAYCTTKFAVVGMTKSLALDHARSGVRFNAICPARVETPFVKQRIAEYPDPAAAYAEMTASQPVGRMGKPQEIAAAALYLAADESAFVTGSCLIIDGAYSAG